MFLMKNFRNFILRERSCRIYARTYYMSEFQNTKFVCGVELILDAFCLVSFKQFLLLEQYVSVFVSSQDKHDQSMVTISSCHNVTSTIFVPRIGARHHSRFFQYPSQIYRVAKIPGIFYSPPPKRRLKSRVSTRLTRDHCRYHFELPSCHLK